MFRIFVLVSAPRWLVLCCWVGRCLCIHDSSTDREDSDTRVNWSSVDGPVRTRRSRVPARSRVGLTLVGLALILLRLSGLKKWLGVAGGTAERQGNAWWWCCAGGNKSANEYKRSAVRWNVETVCGRFLFSRGMVASPPVGTAAEKVVYRGLARCFAFRIRSSSSHAHASDHGVPRGLFGGHSLPQVQSLFAIGAGCRRRLTRGLLIRSLARKVQADGESPSDGWPFSGFYSFTAGRVASCVCPRLRARR